MRQIDPGAVAPRQDRYLTRRLATFGPRAWADVGLDEWITTQIRVAGEKAALYLNDAR